MKQLTNDLDSISLLHDPPEWAVASTTESDDTRMRKRVIGQQKDDHDGNRTIIKRKGKRTLTKKEMIRYESYYPHAFIASGIGPDGDGDIRRGKRRKKLLRTGSIVVGCAAIFFGFIFSREYIPSSFHSPHPTISVEPVRNEMIFSNTLEGIRLATVEGLVDDIRKDKEIGGTEISSDFDSQEKECQDTAAVAVAATAESMVVAADPNKMHILQKIFMDHHEVFCGLFCKHKN